MMPLVSIGPLRLGTYGLCIMIALFVWWSWSERRLGRQQVVLPDRYFILMIGAAWLAGRVGALFESGVSLTSFFTQLIQIRTLEYHGWAAVIGAGVVTVVAARRTQIPVEALWSALIVPTVFAHALCAFGAWLAGIGAGIPWQGPWAMDMLGTLRHPVQLYEALVLLSGGAWLLWRERGGATASVWHLIAIWSAMVLLTAGFRADMWLLQGGIVLAQLIALFGVVVAVDRVMMEKNNSQVIEGD